MTEENKTQPELKDITEMISRYIAANKNNVYFVGGFVSLKKDKEHKCEECGEDCEAINEDGTQLYAYGHLEDLRSLLNGLRDMAEDECDKKGFVNI